MRQLAVARRVAHVLARDLDEIEQRRIMALLPGQRTAPHHHPDRAVARAAMVERKLDLGADGERPFRDQTHPAGRQGNLLPGQLDRVGKADGD